MDLVTTLFCQTMCPSPRSTFSLSLEPTWRRRPWEKYELEKILNANWAKSSDLEGRMIQLKAPAQLLNGHYLLFHQLQFLRPRMNLNWRSTYEGQEWTWTEGRLTKAKNELEMKVDLPKDVHHLLESQHISTNNKNYTNKISERIIKYLNYGLNMTAVTQRKPLGPLESDEHIVHLCYKVQYFTRREIFCDGEKKSHIYTPTMKLGNVNSEFSMEFFSTALCYLWVLLYRLNFSAITVWDPPHDILC